MTQHPPIRPSSTAKVMIVDDHPIVREGLVARIEADPELTCVGEAEGVSAALSQIERAAPDVMIVDISLADGNGLDLVKRVRARYPSVKLLVVSVHDEHAYASRALRAGANGFVNKQTPPEEIVAAVRRVLSGDQVVIPALPEGTVTTQRASGVASLSNRELEVFELIGQGVATKDIAARLGLSVHTIDTYRDKIKNKLGVRGNAALIQRATAWNLRNEK